MNSLDILFVKLEELEPQYKVERLLKIDSDGFINEYPLITIIPIEGDFEIELNNRVVQTNSTYEIICYGSQDHYSSSYVTNDYLHDIIDKLNEINGDFDCQYEYQPISFKHDYENVTKPNLTIEIKIKE